MEYLPSLLKLRRQIKENDSVIERIMPDCIHEALSVLGNEEKNRVVFREGDSKITLTMVKKVPTLKESKPLTRLHEQIVGTKEKLALAKKDELANINLQIATLESQIRELEKQREALLTNQRILTLKSRFVKEQEAAAYFKPTLNVYLL
ncbi:MAG: hypothetical protein ACKN9E_09975 [Microcystaceae cyanobacterium]